MAIIRKPETLGFWIGHLPHWEVVEGRYFVTIHLAGAIPAEGRLRIEQKARELKWISKPAAKDTLLLMRTIFRDMEEWLDLANHNATLARPEVAEMVIDAIEHRAQQGDWLVYEYVVMPSHVHLFLSVLNGTLKESLESFKRWTGHQAARLVRLNDGRFWQDEWFDHWSRSLEQDDRISLYIRRNPETAGLVSSYLDWRYGSWSMRRAQ
jgi:REP element-mobilizing transposase RayT